MEEIRGGRIRKRKEVEAEKVKKGKNLLHSEKRIRKNDGFNLGKR